MRIAIVGSGISGLVCAYLLGKNHEITLFEAGSKAGGHVNTVTAKGDSGSFQVDTGFIVFNRENYPNFLTLLDQLGVDSQPTRMGFSVRSERLGLEYNGENLVGLFGHLKNLVDFKHWGMVRDILRFHEAADQASRSTETVGQFVERMKFGSRFQENFLLPLGSALWSCSTSRFQSFPMEFVTDFLSNHQMLQANNRPVWRVVKGGSKTYVEKILPILGNRLCLNTPVKKVERIEQGVELTLPDGTKPVFDEVILACHADQSLQLLHSPSAEEVALLEAFPYEKNMVSLHRDDSHLPRRRSARASWNAYLPREESAQALVTYDMNILQSLPTSEPFCVSLNQKERIDPKLHHADYHFSHPTYHLGRRKAQEGHRRFIRNQGISFCGAYWGYGFHEDGLTSGLRVCDAFGAKLG
ncbi:MAG: FAD-dependent oxidoreductase [Opitutae bacterium]|nr:FAD-dependent oxidoreductase [Opitutae bacterium]